MLQERSTLSRWLAPQAELEEEGCWETEEGGSGDTKAAEEPGGVAGWGEPHPVPAEAEAGWPAGEEGEAPLELRALGDVQAAMRAHRGSVEVQEAGCGALRRLLAAGGTGAQEEAGELRLLGDVVAGMQGHLACEELQVTVVPPFPHPAFPSSSLLSLVQEQQQTEDNATAMLM